MTVSKNGDTIIPVSPNSIPPAYNANSTANGCTPAVFPIRRGSNACLTKQLRIAKFNVNVNPEFNLMTNYKIAEWMTFEATADWTTQYYHTLEGIPLGWSADLIIPTTSSCPPEHAQQFYAGVLSSLAQHRFTLGAYHKSMSNLVYFPDADKLFSSTIAGWESNVKMGSGTSQGVEILYEKGGECLDL